MPTHKSVPTDLTVPIGEAYFKAVNSPGIGVGMPGVLPKLPQTEVLIPSQRKLLLGVIEEEIIPKSSPQNRKPWCFP